MIEITSCEEINDAELAKEELANLPTMQELLARAEEKGRADAIKEFLKETGKYIYYMDKYTDFEGQMISIENLNLIAEQIGEKDEANR